jgi:hypothetical protein
MISVKSILFTLTIIIASLFLTAWKQSPSADPVVEKLFGKWNWLKTTGGIAGQFSSPSTVKHSEMLEFEKNGKFIRYKDEKVIVENNFILTIDTLIPSRPKTYWLKNVGKYNQSVTFKGNDTLILTDECDDCFISTYARQK